VAMDFISFENDPMCTRCNFLHTCR